MTLKIIIASLGLSLALSACRQNAAQPPEKPAATAKANTVRTIKLPEFDPGLPEGKGRETVQVQCAVCHTTHYILNQPPLSRETWNAEVAKMQKVFSAPIPADKVPEIVEYLLAVRGPVEH